jgi:hypothetical protein
LEPGPERDALNALSDLVGWDGTRYQRGVDVMMPWDGYFVYNPVPNQAVTLRVPAVTGEPRTDDARTSGDTMARTASRRAPSSSSRRAQPQADAPRTKPRPPSAETMPGVIAQRLNPGAAAEASGSTSLSGYRIRMNATLSSASLDRTYTDPNNWMGMAEGASSGMGAEDLPEPPPVGDYVRLSIRGNGSSAHPLATSFKPVVDDGHVWDIEVTSRIDEPYATRKTVTVRFSERERPDGFSLYVLDQDERRLRSLDDGTVTLELSQDQPVRRLRVIAGTRAFARQHNDGIPLQTYENRLLGNYPNPFASTTRIAYQLEKRSNVRLEVYDLLGRRISVLTDEVQQAGPHEIVWDGRAGRGRPVASGVYLYRLTADDFTDTGKMTIVR